MKSAPFVVSPLFRQPHRMAVPHFVRSESLVVGISFLDLGRRWREEGGGWGYGTLVILLQVGFNIRSLANAAACTLKMVVLYLKVVYPCSISYYLYVKSSGQTEYHKFLGESN